MKEFTATASIRATPEAVWAIRTDGPGYARWNPEINRVEGRIALGEKIKAHVHPKTLRGRDLNFLCSRIVVTLDG